MDLGHFIDILETSPAYQQQAVHRERLPPRAARYGDLDQPLPPQLEARLAGRGTWPLFAHQARAINALGRGDHVIVCTSTASGKSLCFHLPVLEALLGDKRATALYLFPTKALAQDQLRSLEELTRGLPLYGDLATFDGDTLAAERRATKRRARLVISNPDMLHLGILPNHQQWGRFLRHLRYVVLDEAHAYRGVFGSHLALILRRLRRLAAQVGAAPQFILASATIANPREHAEALTGLPFTVVDDDGAPFGGKEFVLWNPPVIDPARSARRSANTEATSLMTELVKQEVRSLCFVRTRRLVELVYRYLRERLRQDGRPDLASRISPYRAGYLPEDRRRIEGDLFAGRLLAVVATNALELGIDIGGLDVTVLTGYPGSIAGTWQQAGRSGRQGHHSLAIFIARDGPLDQYLAAHPEFLFGHPHEHALINPSNPHILGPHLLCAAYEAPLSEGDGALFGPALAQTLEELASQGLLRPERGRWHLNPGLGYPADSVNIRSAEKRPYVVLDARSGRPLEYVDSARAFYEVHPGAVWLHQGDSYLISQLDVPQRTARAEAADVPYYTVAKEITDMRILETLRRRGAGGTTAYLQRVEVTNRVTGYLRKRQVTEEVLGEDSLDLPPQSYETVALMWDIPDPILDLLARQGHDLAGSLHAAEHACIGLLPLFALCDRNDIGGLSTPRHPDTGRPQVFIYDGYPGGVGISEKGYELAEELWQATLEHVGRCRCEEGCPGCIQSPKCGNNNQPLDKAGACALLRGEGALH
ncbi:MAG: DEAD/DEAH box helicase [Dehalococcoidia bacterium]|nr:DEAD/DEAH box helicase [Dehalococcoidia bacterium]